MISNILQEQIGLAYVKKLVEPYSLFGKELINQIDFYKDKKALIEEYSNIKLITDLKEAELEKLTGILKRFRNIRSSISRLRSNQVLTLDEIYEMYRYFKLIREIKLFCDFSLLADRINFADYSEILTWMNPDAQNEDGFYIADKFSVKLAQIRRNKRYIEKLLSDADKFNVNEILSRREKVCVDEAEEEYHVREKISIELKKLCSEMTADIIALARLDLWICKAKLVLEYGAIFPDVSDGIFCLEGMFSPEIADRLNKENKKFEPVSIEIEKGATVISGANMGGKSVTLKLMALNAVLAMCGWPVFCRKAVIPLISNISVIADWADNAADNLSSFGNEVSLLKKIIQKMKKSELILLDEPAKSTNPWEGTVIAKGITSFLNKQDLYSVITTHYDEVAHFANLHYRTIGISHVEIDSEIEEDGISLIIKNMKYGITPYPPDANIPREAINICKILGMPRNLMDEIVSIMETKQNG